MNQPHPATTVSLADIVEQRCVEHIPIATTHADERVVDREVMRAVEARQALQQRPLPLIREERAQANVVRWVVPVHHRCDPLTRTPDNRPVRGGMALDRGNADITHSGVDPTIAVRRRS